MLADTRMLPLRVHLDAGGAVDQIEVAAARLELLELHRGERRRGGAARLVLEGLRTRSSRPALRRLRPTMSPTTVARLDDELDAGRVVEFVREARGRADRRHRQRRGLGRERVADVEVLRDPVRARRLNNEDLHLRAAAEEVVLVAGREPEVRRRGEAAAGAEILQPTVRTSMSPRPLAEPPLRTTLRHVASGLEGVDHRVGPGREPVDRRIDGRVHVDVYEWNRDADVPPIGQPVVAEHRHDVAATESESAASMTSPSKIGLSREPSGLVTTPNSGGRRGRRRRSIPDGGGRT